MASPMGVHGCAVHGLSYNADPVVRYSWFASGSSWGYLALPQFSKPDSFQNMTSTN
jgi:hypothetical protein